MHRNFPTADVNLFYKENKEIKRMPEKYSVINILNTNFS